MPTAYNALLISLFLIKLYFLWLRATSQDVILYITLYIQLTEEKKRKGEGKERRGKKEKNVSISPFSLFPENNKVPKLKCILTRLAKNH